MWPMSLYKLMGKDRADKYLRDLGATKPVIVEGVLPRLPSVWPRHHRRDTDRDYLFEIRHRLRPKGRAAGLRFREDKMLGHGHAIAHEQPRAARPNAAKAFPRLLLQ